MQAAIELDGFRDIRITPVNGAKSSMVLYQDCALILVSGNPQDARSKPTIMWRSTGEVTVHGRTMTQVIARADDPHNNSYRWYMGDLLIESARVE